jgi:hypothetical protein
VDVELFFAIKADAGTTGEMMEDGGLKFSDG